MPPGQDREGDGDYELAQREGEQERPGLPAAGIKCALSTPFGILTIAVWRILTARASRTACSHTATMRSAYVSILTNRPPKKRALLIFKSLSGPVAPIFMITFFCNNNFASSAAGEWNP